MRTSVVPDLAEKALALLPGLARHTCENGFAHGIAAELADTETPHLLEHVAFELMALSGSPRSLRGETAWDFSADGRGVFRVRLGYDDDLVVLGALRAAVGVCEWLLKPSIAEEPDIDTAGRS
jgi:cyanophycin synthetase